MKSIINILNFLITYIPKLYKIYPSWSKPNKFLGTWVPSLPLLASFWLRLTRKFFICFNPTLSSPGSISNGSIPASTLTSPPEDATPSPGNDVTSATSATTATTIDSMKQNFFNSLKLRGFDTFCLLNANDADVFDFIQVSCRWRHPSVCN